MTTFQRLTLVAVVLLCAGVIATAGDIKSSGKKGFWSGDSTWVGGVKPTSLDNVIIATGDEVTMDLDSVVVNSITVGEDSSAILQFVKTKAVAIVINGSLIINKKGSFRVQTRTAPATADLIHRIYLYGHISNHGTGFDLRTGSTNTDGAVANLWLLGSVDQTLTMDSTFTTSNGEFNAITVNKSGIGKVILGSDIVIGSGSSSNTNAYPTLRMLRGKVYTGNFALIHRYAFADSGSVWKWSDSSYVVGALGRGMGNSGGATRAFPVGDENGLRTVTVRSTLGGSQTGHYILVRCVPENANTGTSTLSVAIDKVSAVRYYSIRYFKGYQSGTQANTSMPVDRFKVEYKAEDGVGDLNNDLRLAFSTNARANWTAMGQVVPDTTFKPDAAIQDSMAAFTLNTGVEVVYLALARIAGTTTNTLVQTTSVEQIDATPQEWTLQQNYPNPFNPSTQIRFSMPQTDKATLKVYTLLGQTVATLVDGVREAGTHVATWNGKDASGRSMPSGMYLYRLESGSRVEMKKMVLMK